MQSIHHARKSNFYRTWLDERSASDKFQSIVDFIKANKSLLTHRS